MPFMSAVDWLKALAIIPDDVNWMRPVLPKIELDPAAIPVGYLAAVAFEWDSWGESTPEQFLDAIQCEMRGARRDAIAELLMSLGREANQAEALDAVA